MISVYQYLLCLLKFSIELLWLLAQYGLLKDYWIEQLGNPTEKLRGPLKKEIGYKTRLRLRLRLFGFMKTMPS